MIRSKSKFVGVALAVVFFASAGFADTPVTLVTPGPYTMGGVYVGPYYASVNNSPTLTPIICDDFTAETFLNESWTADVINFSDIGTVGTKFTTLYSTDWQSRYNQVAWLSLQLFDLSPSNPNPNCSVESNCRGDIQFAIWEIFSDTPYGTTDGVKKWLTLASSHTNVEAGYANLVVFEPTGVLIPRGAPLPQEFIGLRVSEASAPAILAFNMAGLVALVLFFRRRRIHSSH